MQSVQQLADIGILKADTDAKQFADNCYAFFDGVPDTYSADEIGIDSNTSGEAPAASAAPASVSVSDGEDDCCSGGSRVGSTEASPVTKA